MDFDGSSKDHMHLDAVRAFRVLGVVPKASREEIKLAYLALAKKWHPDLHQGQNKAAAEIKFKEVQAAFQLVQDGGGQSGSGGGDVGFAGRRHYTAQGSWQRQDARWHHAYKRAAAHGEKHEDYRVYLSAACAAVFGLGMLAFSIVSFRERQRVSAGRPRHDHAWITRKRMGGWSAARPSNWKPGSPKAKRTSSEPAKP